MLNDKDISVVIFANSKDYFLTKLCVASIRNCNPDVEIFLVKDYLNGNFNSKVLEKKFNVKQIKLSKRYFGWGAAKIHFLLENAHSNKKYLCLDSDIIIIGNLIDKLKQFNSGFVLHHEIYDMPFTDKVKQVFIDPEKVKKFYPQYEYPGYFFNVGQFLITPSFFREELLVHCFDKNKYPYYSNRENFNMAEQAILNALLPIVFKENNINPDLYEFMKWSVSFFEKPENNNLNLLSNNKPENSYLIHYAGDVRVPDIKKMKGFAFLNFFKNKYEERLNFFQKLSSRIQDKIFGINYFTRVLRIKNVLLIKFLKY